MADKRKPTAAQVRGQIQSGESGDIRSGFDPAMAPMETDAEAGGQPTTPQQAQMALDTQAPGKPDKQGSYDVAMRQSGSNDTTSQTGPLARYIIIIVCLIVLLIGLVILSGLLPGAHTLF